MGAAVASSWNIKRADFSESDVRDRTDHKPNAGDLDLRSVVVSVHGELDATTGTHFRWVRLD